MPDQTAFEARLTDAYARYVAAAPVVVDPRFVAATVATGRLGRSMGWSNVFAPGRRVALLIAVGLVVLAVAVGAAFVGSQVSPRPTVPPTSGPSAVVPGPLPSDASGDRGVFTTLPDMAISRIDPVVVTLADGRVLIAAGQDSTGTDVPAEVLDLVTLRYETIAHGTPSGSSGGSGVVLPDGRVFVIVHDGNETASRAYLVDPRSMTSHVIPQKEYANAPVFGVNPSMALLHDGRVLIAGGLADVYKSNLLATAQLFDPATETFARTGSMAVPRWRHSMTTLLDGRVLVAGGEGRADMAQPGGDPIPPDDRRDAEIYDPRTGSFTPTGSMPEVRGATLAVAVPDGRVVVLPRVGTFSALRGALGLPATYDPTGRVPVEAYDPATGTFTPAGTTPGIVTTATSLGSGQILMTGITGTPGAVDPLGTWAVLYDPASGQTRAMTPPRALFATPATLGDGQLFRGRVLFAGGGLPTSGGWPADPVHWVEIFQ